MIKVKMERDNSVGQTLGFVELSRREVDPLEAVRILAKVELAFGGNVTEVSDNHLVVVTRVLGCLDRTTFEGSAENMQPVFELAYLYTQAGAEHGDDIVEACMEQAKRLLGDKVGSPFYLSMLAPMLIGSNRLRIAVMAACGLTDEADFEAGMRAEINDIIAAVQLANEGTCSFQEALATG